MVEIDKLQITFEEEFYILFARLVEQIEAIAGVLQDCVEALRQSR